MSLLSIFPCYPSIARTPGPPQAGHPACIEPACPQAGSCLRRASARGDSAPARRVNAGGLLRQWGTHWRTQRSVAPQSAQEGDELSRARRAQARDRCPVGSHRRPVVGCVPRRTSTRATHRVSAHGTASAHGFGVGWVRDASSHRVPTGSPSCRLKNQIHGGFPRQTRAGSCPVPVCPQAGSVLISGSQLETGNWKLLCDPAPVQRALPRAPFDNAARRPAVRTRPLPSTIPGARNKPCGVPRSGRRPRPAPNAHDPHVTQIEAILASPFSDFVFSCFRDSALFSFELASRASPPRVSRTVVRPGNLPCASPGIPVSRTATRQSQEELDRARSAHTRIAHRYGEP